MITQDEIKKIKQLKRNGYSHAKIAKKLKISTSTISRHSGPKKLKLDDLFLVAACPECGTVYPKPKFLGSWQTPCCRHTTNWKKGWFDIED